MNKFKVMKRMNLPKGISPLFIAIGAVILLGASRTKTPPGADTSRSDITSANQNLNVVNENSNQNIQGEENSDPVVEPGEENTNQAMEQEVKTFNITGRKFAFSPTEIRVKRGDQVKIVFTSIDGFHDWTVDEFNAATTQVNTGETATVQFLADRTGTFEYYCSVGNHRQMGMVGQLIVE